jgi:hypothetical protein
MARGGSFSLDRLPLLCCFPDSGALNDAGDADDDDSGTPVERVGSGEHVVDTDVTMLVQGCRRADAIEKVETSNFDRRPCRAGQLIMLPAVDST